MDYSVLTIISLIVNIGSLTSYARRKFYAEPIDVSLFKRHIRSMDINKHLDIFEKSKYTYPYDKLIDFSYKTIYAIKDLKLPLKQIILIARLHYKTCLLEKNKDLPNELFYSKGPKSNDYKKSVSDISQLRYDICRILQEFESISNCNKPDRSSVIIMTLILTILFMAFIACTILLFSTAI